MLVTPFRDECDFWSHQLSEHALFLQLGTEVPAFKGPAGAMHAEWERFRNTLPRISDQEAKARVLVLCKRLAALKQSVITAMDSGAWTGWLFRSFVAHTLHELVYFVAKITNGIDPKLETCTWLRFMAEHAAFAAKLVDIDEAKLFQEAMQYASQFASIEGACSHDLTPSMLELSRRAGGDLDRWFSTSGLGTKRVHSVVHPVLAEHVVREGRRFVTVIDQLRASQA